MSSDSDSDGSWVYFNENAWTRDNIQSQEWGLEVEERYRNELKRDEDSIRENISKILDKPGHSNPLVTSAGVDRERSKSVDRGSAGVRRAGLRVAFSIRGEEITVAELRKHLIAEFRQCNLRHRIIHTIYARTVPYEDSDDEVDRSIQRTFHGNLFIIGLHGEHYHIIHDCNWGSSTCRCGRIRAIEQEGRMGKRLRYNRKITSTSSWNIEHWINLFIYLNAAERRISYAEVSGKWWIRNRGDQCSESFEGSAFRLERGLERIRFSDQVSCGVSDRYNTYPGDEIDTEYQREIRASRGLQATDLPEAEEPGSSSQMATECGRRRRGDDAEQSKTRPLFEFLQGIVFSPPKAIFQSRIWLKSKYRYVDKRKNYFNVILQELQLFYTEKTVLELWNHLLHCDPLHLMFASENPSEYYFSLQQSVEYLESLLCFQMEDDEGEISQFLYDLLAILDKTKPKCNTFFVHGEANAGKNFFFDAVMHFCVNFGIITNWNRFNQFPLQDCPNRRVLFWNEPNFEDGVEETLKLLFGGDQCGARIKYEGDAVIARTPIIVLSNVDCFPRNEAFRSRMIKYKWRACSYLRDLRKKPHPLAVPYLFARWHVISWHDVDYDFTDEEKLLFQEHIY